MLKTMTKFEDDRDGSLITSFCIFYLGTVMPNALASVWVSIHHTKLLKKNKKLILSIYRIGSIGQNKHYPFKI